MMAWTLFALLPGSLAQTVFDDAGTPTRIALAVLFALVFEAAMLRLRAQPLRLFLSDLSAPVTAVLFALWLPATSPWWFAPLGMGVAIVLAKQAFGGLGRNLFNPAMAGCAVLFVFWPQVPSPRAIDGALWMSLGYALGGGILIALGIVRWQVPAAMLGTVTAVTLIADTLGAATITALASSASVVPWLIAAFFLATDPVTSCSSPRGRWIFGAATAALALGMQARGAAPQMALCFAILLMNAAAPWIDRGTEPRAWSRST